MEFITANLMKAWNTEGIGDSMTLTLLPYGNVKTSGGDTQCQHGETECHYNMMEGCAIQKLGKAEDYVPFVICAEKMFAGQGSPKIDDVLHECVSDSDQSTKIATCFGEGAGVEALSIFKQNGAATKLVNHHYVPWVTVNGEHSELAEKDLVKGVCAAITDGDTPAACRIPDMILKASSARVNPGVCMKGLSSEEDHDFRRHLERLQKEDATRSIGKSEERAGSDTPVDLREEYRRYKDGLLQGEANHSAIRPVGSSQPMSHEEHSSQPQQHIAAVDARSSVSLTEKKPPLTQRQQKKHRRGDSEVALDVSSAAGMLLRREEFQTGA